MSNLSEAAQQALAYIEQVDYGPYDAKPVITALRAALADQRKPLTEADVAKIMDFGQYGKVPAYAMNFVRAIEAAHGITGDSNGS